MLEKGRALIKAHYDSPDRVKTASVRILEEHSYYFGLLTKAFAYKADGDNEKAAECVERLAEEMEKKEIYLERYFEHFLATYNMRRLTKL